MDNVKQSLTKTWKECKGVDFEKFGEQIATVADCEYEKHKPLDYGKRTWDIIITSDPKHVFSPFKPLIGIECKSGKFDLDQFRASKDALLESDSNLAIYITKTDPDEGAKREAVLLLKDHNKLICFFGPYEAELLLNSAYPLAYYLPRFLKACRKDPSAGSLHLRTILEEDRKKYLEPRYLEDTKAESKETLMHYNDYVAKLLRTLIPSSLVQCVNQAAPYHWIRALGVTETTRNALDEYRNIISSSVHSALMFRVTVVQDIMELTSVLRSIYRQYGKKECLEWIRDAKTFPDIAHSIPNEIEEVINRIDQGLETEQDLEVDRRLSLSVMKWFTKLHFPKEGAVYRVEESKEHHSALALSRHEELIADQKHWIQTEQYSDVEDQVKVTQNYEVDKIRERLTDWLQMFSESYWAPIRRSEIWSSGSWKKLGSLGGLSQFVGSEQYSKILITA